MMALIAALGALAVVALAGVRLFVGPTLQDRMLGANLMIIGVVLVCAALASLARNPLWTEVAIALLLCCYALNVAALRVFRLNSLQAPLSGQAEPAP
jgi:multisubunit Na+/H+ antiporter MnhF subunit